MNLFLFCQLPVVLRRLYARETVSIKMATCPISVRVPLQVFLCVSLTTGCQLPCAGAVGTSSESNKMHKMKTWLGPMWKMELVFQFNRLKKPGRFCAQLTLNGSCSSPYLFPMV